jgi:DNA-binding MarR family transcriptional regulator
MAPLNTIDAEPKKKNYSLMMSENRSDIVVMRPCNGMEQRINKRMGESMSRESCCGGSILSSKTTEKDERAGASLAGRSGHKLDTVIDERATTRILIAKAWRRANDFPREMFCDATLFSNPALNILLDLYIAHHEQVAINVSSACFASSAPPTTALRYITRLVQLGFVERSSDQRDQRVNLLSLTHEGISRMVRLLDDVCDSNRRLNICSLKPVE